jgi:hypothetical protein
VRKLVVASYRPAKRKRMSQEQTSFSAQTTAIDGPGDRVRVTGGVKKEGVPTVVFANPRRSSRWCTNRNIIKISSAKGTYYQEN